VAMNIVSGFFVNHWQHLILPLVVFVFCSASLISLGTQILTRLFKWTKTVNWPAESIIYQPVKRPFYILCLIFSAYLAIVNSVIPDKWKDLTGHSLLTLLIFAIVLAVLNILSGLLLLLAKHWNLPNGISTAKTITNIVVIALSTLIVLPIWGVPTAPLFILVIVAAILILLTTRDAAPNFFAGIQLITWQHLKVGELIKLENGEEGFIDHIGYSAVQILTTNGNKLIIPNGQLTKQRVTIIGHRVKQVENTAPVGTLSEREKEIAQLISQGTTNKEIAAHLFIAENTVKVHVKNILKKLELKNRQQLAVYTVLQEDDNPQIYPR
jgi:DNA-binding CsgD family transcriptional regulator